MNNKMLHRQRSASLADIEAGESEIGTILPGDIGAIFFGMMGGSA